MTELTQTYSHDMDGVWQALLALGDEDNKVAAVLRGMGIKGKPTEACACPIANYLAGIFGEMSTPEVDGDSVKLLGWDHTGHMQLPTAIVDFVVSFDSDVYPDLIEKEPVNA